MHTRVFPAKPLCLRAIVRGHIHLGVKQLQTREVFPQYCPHSSLSPTTSIRPMIYEVKLILFSPTQCPDYKQLFIVTYSNKRVMGPRKSTSWHSHSLPEGCCLVSPLGDARLGEQGGQRQC